MELTCYYINLDRSLVRRQFMEAQSAQLGLNLWRIPAVDGTNLSPTEVLSYQPANSPRRRLTCGEIACFLSHREAWKRIASGDTRYGAIFEDDVHFSPSAKVFLSDDDWIADLADVVKLETVHDKLLLGADVATVADGRRLKPLVSRHLGTGGYLMSRDCATRLLVATEQCHVPIDHLLFEPGSIPIQNLRIVQLTPAICIQEICLSNQQLPKLLSDERSTLTVDRAQIPRHERGPVRAAIKWMGNYPEQGLRQIRRRLAARKIGGSWETVEYR